VGEWVEGAAAGDSAGSAEPSCEESVLALPDNLYEPVGPRDLRGVSEFLHEHHLMPHEC